MIQLAKCGDTSWSGIQVHARRLVLSNQDLSPRFYMQKIFLQQFPLMYKQKFTHATTHSSKHKWNIWKILLQQMAYPRMKIKYIKYKKFRIFMNYEVFWDYVHIYMHFVQQTHRSLHEQFFLCSSLLYVTYCNAILSAQVCC